MTLLQKLDYLGDGVIIGNQVTKKGDENEESSGSNHKSIYFNGSVNRGLFMVSE